MVRTLLEWIAAASVVGVLAVLAIRKARACGRRLFRDEPTARAKALNQDTSHLHEQDAM